jgi:hypothetical protein
LWLYTNVYVMFVHTSFTDSQAPGLKSPKNQGGQEEIDDDDEDTDSQSPEPDDEVCTHIAFVHNFVGRVCTRIVFVHKCVRHVCTQMCTSCLYTNVYVCPYQQATKEPSEDVDHDEGDESPQEASENVCISIAFSIVLAMCVLIMKIIAIYAATTNQDTNESGSKLKRCSFPECKTLLQS